MYSILRRTFSNQCVLHLAQVHSHSYTAFFQKVQFAAEHKWLGSPAVTSCCDLLLIAEVYDSLCHPATWEEKSRSKSFLEFQEHAASFFTQVVKQISGVF